MTQHSPADDFLAAARTAGAAPKESRHDLLRELLAVPFPAEAERISTMVLWFDRLNAAMTLDIGDIVETLAALPLRKGHRFCIRSESSRVSGMLKLRCDYAPPRQKNSRLPEHHVFSLEGDFDDTRFTAWRFWDGTRPQVTDGAIEPLPVAVAHLADLRAAMGAAVGRAAPHRLPELAARLGTPAAAVARDANVATPRIKGLPPRP